MLDRLLVGASPDAVGAGHRQDVAASLPFEPAAHLVPAVDRVPHHPACRHPGAKCPRQELARQLAFGREAHPPRDMRLLATLAIAHPLVGQIQGPVDEGGATLGGVEQEDPDLLVLSATRGPAVLARHAARLGPLLDEPRLVDDQHPAALVGQVLQDVGAQLVAHRLRVPVGGIQEALHALGPAFPQRLGQLPAILALDMSEQPFQIAPGPLACLTAAKARGDAGVQRRKSSAPQPGERRRFVGVVHEIPPRATPAVPRKSTSFSWQLSL